ncbi:hypothetical protein [Amaricoccus tamworthensis]|uniref:hypothetical protein n=1 Tax=Amaricoccus tamworthensis TaxID=57002 RepID=UPI003C7C37B2
MFRMSLTVLVFSAALPIQMASAETTGSSVRRSPQVIDVNPAAFENSDSGTITIHRGSRRSRDTGRWTAASGIFTPTVVEESFHPAGDCNDGFLSGVAEAPLP